MYGRLHIVYKDGAEEFIDMITVGQAWRAVEDRYALVRSAIYTPSAVVMK